MTNSIRLPSVSDIRFLADEASRSGGELGPKMRALLEIYPRLLAAADDAGGLSHDEIIEACRNIGHDLTCPVCSELFYTGGTSPRIAHTCGLGEIRPFPRHREAREEAQELLDIEQFRITPEAWASLANDQIDENTPLRVVIGGKVYETTAGQIETSHDYPPITEVIEEAAAKDDLADIWTGVLEHAAGEQLPPFVRRLALDFDGVVHQHTSQWTGPLDIHDPPVPGAFDFIRDLIARRWTVFIHTTRLCHGIDPAFSDIQEIDVELRKEAILAWFELHGFKDIRELGAKKQVVLWTSGGKPPAYFYLDDHAIRFNGVFPTYDELVDLRWPWHKKTYLQVGRSGGKSTDLSNLEVTSPLVLVERLRKFEEFLRDPLDDVLLTTSLSKSCSFCGCPIDRGAPRWVHLWLPDDGREPQILHQHRACRCITDDRDWSEWVTADSLNEYLSELLGDDEEGCAVTDLPETPLLLDVVQDEYHEEWAAIWAQLRR